MEAHLAEPAETRARRGPKRRAKTDRADARLLRDLLLADNVPESWIPPAHLADLRTTVRLRKALVDSRSAWIRRMQAQLFHHGLPPAPDLSTLAGRDYVISAPLPSAGHQVVEVGSRMLEVFDEEIEALDRQLESVARRQVGCQVLQRQWGIGPILSTAILAELGDTRRFSSSRQSVRFSGLDVTVEESQQANPDKVAAIRLRQKESRADRARCQVPRRETRAIQEATPRPLLDEPRGRPRASPTMGEGQPRESGAAE
jgi:transposase